MKAFILSISIIIAIFALTIINSIHVSRSTDILIKEASAIDIDTKSTKRFEEIWKKRQIIIRISSSHEEIHKLDEALSVLKAKAENGISEGFFEERALLVEYLIEIQEDEIVTFDSII